MRFFFFLIDLPRVRLRFDWPLQAPYACVHVLLSRSITINMPVTRHMHVHGASTCSLSAGMVQPPLVDLRVCRDSDDWHAKSLVTFKKHAHDFDMDFDPKKKRCRVSYELHVCFCCVASVGRPES